MSLAYKKTAALSSEDSNVTIENSSQSLAGWD